MYKVKKVNAGLVQDSKLQSLHGKWGFFDDAINRPIPLSVWDGEGVPTQEWIDDCIEYYFGVDDEEAHFKKIREDAKKSPEWLASHDEGVDAILTEKLT